MYKNNHHHLSQTRQRLQVDIYFDCWTPPASCWSCCTRVTPARVDFVGSFGAPLSIAPRDFGLSSAPVAAPVPGISTVLFSFWVVFSFSTVFCFESFWVHSSVGFFPVPFFPPPPATVAFFSSGAASSSWVGAKTTECPPFSFVFSSFLSDAKLLKSVSSHCSFVSVGSRDGCFIFVFDNRFSVGWDCFSGAILKIEKNN